MSTPMSSPADIRAFLDREWPTMLGVVGTVRPDGSPHVVPVWYRYDGERVNIWTHDARQWVKNLARDDRVAFSVQEDRPPFAAVLMRGRAEIVTGQSEEIAAEIRRITRRYIPTAEVEAYVAGWSNLWTIVRVRPEKIRAWGRGY